MFCDLGGLKMEVRKMSNYVFPIPLENGNVALYNSVNASLVELQSEQINKNKIITSSLPEEDIFSLEDMGYFISKEDAIKHLSGSYDDNNKLTISVEITDCCNLRCPYCYQGDHTKRSFISDETIDHILKYIHNVYSKHRFEILHLIVLGGEPSLARKQFLKLVSGVGKLCRNWDVQFNLSVDTNGTIVEYLKEFDQCDSVSVTIPLSYKVYHDNVRKDSIGYGTYEKIIKNVNWIYENLPHIIVNIRHNTDGTNYLKFEDFIKDLSQQLIKKPNIFVNYTLELDSNFKNGLTYLDFLNWKSTTVVDVLIKYDMDILFAPLLLMNRCMMNEPYSIKISNDLTVAPCAMFFAEPNKIHIKDVAENIQILNQRYKKEKKYSVLEQPCANCHKLFLCGGGKLPCFDVDYKGTQCDCHLSHGVNTELFIKKYLFYCDQGKEDLFVYFNDPTPRR